ncbi:MAG: PaaI family thioesterase [Silicimonas sp.]|nr:PaaI family thioesterase [Silicimonas sp.]
MNLAPEIDAKLRASFARQTMMATLGAEMTTLRPGACEIRAPILPGSLQQQGAAHAALTFAIGDSAAGYAALTLMPAETEVMTVEMKINLMRPALGDLLIARGTVVKPGRRLSVVQAEVVAVKDGVEKAVALMQGTMIPV